MAWKLPKNSIFATLLRSPWWVSVLVGVFLAALTAVLLPQRFKAVGVLSTLPFYVIGAIAAWKQSRLPSRAALEAVEQKFRAMDWPACSAHLQARLRASGFEVSVSRLEGVDLEATQGASKTLICARRWKSARTGVEPLRQLKRAAQVAEANDCVYVTLGEVSEAALEYAAAEGVRVWRVSELLTLG